MIICPDNIMLLIFCLNGIRKKLYKIFHIYRPQTKFAKVMFLHVSVCPHGGVSRPQKVWLGGGLKVHTGGGG